MADVVGLRGIFVDTSAWLTLINRNDRYHEAAVQFHRSLAPSVSRLTTWGILAETYTWLRYHEGYRQAERWMHESAALQSRGALDVVYPTAATETEIHRYLSRFADQDLSYVDALSLYVVQARGDIDAIFAFDRHMVLAGKPVLPGPMRPARVKQ